MATDKFGRFSVSNAFAERGPPGIGFVLTEDGNYNMKNKQLKFIKTPSDSSDACTKNYVDLLVNHQTLALNIKSNCFDASNKRVVNIADPKDDYDAVNMKYFEKLKKSVLEKSLCRNKIQNEEFFDAGHRRISRIKHPELPSDAATKNYVDLAVDTVNNKISLITNNIPAMINQKYFSIEKHVDEQISRLDRDIEDIREESETRGNFILTINGKLEELLKSHVELINRFRINIATLNEKRIFLERKLEELEREIEKLTPATDLTDEN